tara:strand:+ start:538 stop:1395 length:858 start_codon:yes stop_codon:yes gene_type:complete
MLASQIEKILSEKIEIKRTNYKDFEISGPSTIDNLKQNTFIFAKQIEKKSSFPKNILVLVDNAELCDKNVSFIEVENCRYAFSILLNEFNKPKIDYGICETSIINKEAKISEECSIGSFVKISKGCEVGKNTVIESHTFLDKNVKIGENVYIKSGARLGGQGFGFERDHNNNPQRIWHSGGLIISDNVEIGTNSIICGGTVNPTQVMENCKIDDNVFIAHNCIIGERTMIAGCADLGGSVIVGSDVWIGPNVTIINKVSIGDKADIVLGTSVFRDVPAGKVYMRK